MKIFENRTGEEVNGIPAHSQRIVLNSAYDNETIANVIMQHLVDGNMFGLQGNISVEVVDSQGTTEIIKFDRAEILSIYLKVQVTVKENVPIQTVQQMVRDNVINFIKENKFDMGSTIWANMFASSIYKVESVTAITE